MYHLLLLILVYVLIVAVDNSKFDLAKKTIGDVFSKPKMQQNLAALELKEISSELLFELYNQDPAFPEPQGKYYL